MRISAISYLNTAPLMWDFEHGAAGGDFEISYTVPSRCAAELKTGTADIGIIPAAAYATIPGLRVIPGVAIASRRPVRSILLVCKKPLGDVKTVALDNSSLTSVALLKVLFHRWWGGGRALTSAEPDIKKMLATHDAGLLIGDPALRIDRSQYHTYDLAEEWLRLTGKPFVFAFWAVRQDAAKETHLDLSSIFQTSRDHGLAPSSTEQIAREWSPRTGLSETEICSYLTENIHYYLDPDCVEGLQLFYRYAHEYGILPPAPLLHFIEFHKPVPSPTL